MTPLVSVIVPIHNGARFLGEALDSIAVLDYGPVEVIVVDDGSTDDGAALAEARGLTVLRQKQRGAGAARNSGIDAARGEILAFLDQDDLWLPSKLRQQVELLLERSDRFCLARQAYFLDGVERPAWFGRPELLAVDHTGFAPSCLAVGRATFERVGRFDEGLLHASDLDWFARAKESGIAMVEPSGTLVRRRIHQANESGLPATMTDLFVALRRAAARKRATAGES